jgi:hypothetical protein
MEIEFHQLAYGLGFSIVMNQRLIETKTKAANGFSLNSKN